MWRHLVLLASIPAIPRNCDPPPEPSSYECRTLPAELDFGEVETFTRRTRVLGLDNRDRLRLGPVSEPFSVRQTVQFQALALAVDFAPRDAKLHVQELPVRLSPECPEQVLRLVGLGSGALETPSVELDFGVTPRAQRVERLVPFTNTRREVVSVSGFSRGPNRIELVPSQFTLEPSARQEVLVRLFCLGEGVVTDTVEFQSGSQRINFLVTGTCE